MAEWARLLSECRGNLVAGSNPALPATRTRLSCQACFCFLVARPHREDNIRIPPSPPRETRLNCQTCFSFYHQELKLPYEAHYQYNE